MTLCVIYSRGAVTYKASLLSAASLFVALCNFLNFFVPLLLVYGSDGFWIKSQFFLEQPSVAYKHQLLLMLELSAGSKLFWSSSPKLLATVDGSALRTPLIINHEIDYNNDDGLNDELSLELSMPLRPNEQVIGVDLMLFFDYRLSSKVKLQMEGLAFASARTSSSTLAAKLLIVADLRLHQKEPLQHRGYDLRFNQPLLERQPIDEFSMADLLRDYLRQNLTTTLGQNVQYLWESGRDGTRDQFKLDVTIFYPVQQIVYRPGPWFVLKWGLIQYLSVFLIFYFLFGRIKGHVFGNQIINSIVCHQPLPPSFIDGIGYNVKQRQ